MAGTSHAEWSGFRVHDPIWKVAAVSSPEQQSSAVGFIGLGEQGAPMAQAIGDPLTVRCPPRPSPRRHPELPLPRTLAEEI
jgi:hypothetical protein